MAHATITTLNELNVHKQNSTVKVRIIRLWKQTYATEMVLMDEQGNKMLASVFEKCLHLFGDLLVENDCFFIKHLSIRQDLAKYKYVNNPLKASFTPTTRLTRCSDFSGAYYGFEFTSFDLLIRNLLPENKTVDVIGYIESYFPMKDIVKKDLTTSKRMNLVLKDGESRRINLTLWDSYAEQMSNYLLTHGTDTDVVIILQFGLFKFWQGRAGVSNSFHITKLYINEDICDINLFKKNLIGTNNNDASSSRSRVPSLNISLDDDFLTNTQFKHIAEINDIKEEMSVIVFGTVLPISKHTKWYYDACKICKIQLTEIVGDVERVDVDVEDEGKKLYHCKRCNKEMLEAGKRYKIHINVQDSTGVVDLILWDWEASKILKKSAETLYQEVINGVADLFPKDLKNLEDQRFAFKINITSYNLTRNYKLYTISKLTQDANILNELKGKLNIEHNANSELMNSTSADAPSQDTVNSKDMVVSINDSTTPVSHEVRSTVIGAFGSKNSNLKRNLMEIYPDEEAMGHSASKARTTSKANDNSQGKDNLLTPKEEK